MWSVQQKNYLQTSSCAFRELCLAVLFLSDKIEGKTSSKFEKLPCSLKTSSYLDQLWKMYYFNGSQAIQKFSITVHAPDLQQAESQFLCMLAMLVVFSNIFQHQMQTNCVIIRSLKKILQSKHYMSDSLFRIEETITHQAIIRFKGISSQCRRSQVGSPVPQEVNLNLKNRSSWSRKETEAIENDKSALHMECWRKTFLAPRMEKRKKQWLYVKNGVS